MAIAVAVTGSVFAVLFWRVENDRSETTQVMPFMDDPSHWPYWLSQAFGWSALLWAWFTVLAGLTVAANKPSWFPVRTSTIERIHRTTSLSVIGLTLAHMLLVSQHALADDGVWVAIGGSFVPWVYSHEAGRFAILLGIVAFYGTAVLGLSYYWRHRIGIRTWRFAHRFTIFVYVIAVWHTFIYGTNVWYTGWQRTALWVMQLPVAALLLVRLLAPRRSGERLTKSRRHRPFNLAPALAARLATAGVLIALVTIIGLDRTGGHQRPAQQPSAGTPAHHP